jgi:hypothetical protein
VVIDVCQYGPSNLPMDSPKNAAMRRRMEEWAHKCAHLQNYDYVLILGHGRTVKMPLPMVRGIVSRAQFLHGLGALNGGSQASHAEMRYCPWNYYAYARMLWNVELTEEQVLEHFFTAYFQEAAGPMRGYYRMLEDHVVGNDISLQGASYGCWPAEGCLTPELAREMLARLDEADRLARYWVVKRRLRTMREGLLWTAEKLQIEIDAD